MENIFDDDFIEFIDYVIEDPFPNIPRSYIRDLSNPMDYYTSKEFFQLYRINKEIIRDQLFSMISNSVVNNRGLPVPPLLKLLVALRFFATGSFQTVCGDLHGLSQSTVSVIIKIVSREISEHLHEWVAFPNTHQASANCMEKFYNLAEFPGVIGCIDCTHVPIQNLGGEFGEMYRNKKGWFSLNIQIVVGPEMEILDIVCRWPGSVNDACIFSNSRLKKRFELEELNGILLGDSGYPLLPYLYTPLLSPRTPSEQRYNAAHATTRNLVERCFGLWKRRFPCLAMKLRTKLRTTVQVILSCAILHNIAIQLKDPVPEPQECLQAQNDPSSAHYHLHGRATLERAAFINRHF